MSGLKEKDKIEELQQKIVELEGKVKEKEAQFDSITENTLDGYWVWKIKENEMYISPQLKKMVGYEDKELANSPDTINMLMHPSDLPDTYALLGKHIESNGKIPFEIEVRYKHKNDSIVWVICTGNIVQRDENGEPAVMIGCHLDNTALKKAEGIQKYAEELEQKNKELEEFAFVASHDLQEPLNTIKGFVDLLIKDDRIKQNDDTSTYLRHIDDSTSRMSSLIKGLLEYNLIGKESSIAKVETSEILSIVLKDLNDSIEETNAKITIGDIPPVMGYYSDLRILFQNLISNALKFRRIDQTPEININCVKDEDYYTFSISDNGIGIDAQFDEKIFELYKKLHAKDKFAGNGLGLAKCKKIVSELHKGKIWTHPNKNGGSVFLFTIPISI